MLDAVAELAPDAVLTDIRMPPGHHMEAIDAAHRIRAEHPDDASPAVPSFSSANA